MKVNIDDDDLYTFLFEVFDLIEQGETQAALYELKELLKGTRYHEKLWMNEEKI